MVFLVQLSPLKLARLNEDFCSSALAIVLVMRNCPLGCFDIPLNINIDPSYHSWVSYEHSWQFGQPFQLVHWTEDTQGWMLYVKYPISDTMSDL